MVPVKNRQNSCDLFIIIIIIIINFLAQVFSDCTEAVATSLIPLVTNFSEICAFIIGFRKSTKKIQNRVTECLQTLYQSVAIHLKYVLLVLI